MQPGTRLGPYEIVSRIGAGGMGEVWRARDTRLGRDVAIKTLPVEFQQDAKLKIRFEREAKTISLLNHPNICTLFDVGENYIVMELLEGESLANRLLRGPMPLSDVTRYGAEIAEALNKGHQNGIVHRDVKPGNVMITKSGAKLLDFGLAKSSIVDVDPEPDDSTVLNPLTKEGMIVGTPQYMAPEQLEGSDADARSDIFALGAVLYEMATGRRAFGGASRASLVAAILSGDPRPIRELQPLAPAALEHVIRKCLEKAPERRWQSAADIAGELRWIGDGGSNTEAAATPGGHRKSTRWLAWIAALLAAIAAGAWLQLRTWRSVPPSIEVAIPLDASGGIAYHAGPPVFSPDGSRLVFVGAKGGQRLIWIRELKTGRTKPVANTDGGRAPFWSPDGRYFGFVANGEIRKVLPDGGKPEVITTDVRAASCTWSRGGDIVFSAGRGAPLYRMPSSGGAAEVLLVPDSIGALHLLWPRFLPDGRRFVFLAEGSSLRKSKRAGIWVASLDAREKPRFLVEADTHGCYVKPGWLLFARDGALRALPVDATSLAPRGDEVTIADVATTLYWWGVFDASDAGMLVLQRPTEVALSELVLKSPDGETIRQLGRGDFWTPRLSHDGRRIAVDVTDESGQGDIWIFGLKDGSASRLTFEATNQTSPVWSPDDTAIAFNEGEVDPGIRVMRPGRTGDQVLNLPTTDELPTDWSSDGRFLAVHRSGGRGSGDVVVISLADAKVTEIEATPANEGAAVFSPDSKWIAYQSDQSGRAEIYVQPFPPDGTKYQVTRSGGRSPRWRQQETITFVDESNNLSVVQVTTGPPLTASSPRTTPIAFEPRSGVGVTDYDIDPEGNVLLNVVDRDHPAPLTLITNWTSRVETVGRR